MLEGSLIKFLFKSPVFLPAALSVSTVATFTNVSAIKTRRNKKKAGIFTADLAIAVNAELCYVHVSPPGDSGDETKEKIIRNKKRNRYYKNQLND